MSLLPFLLLGYQAIEREIMSNDEQPICWICEEYVNSETKKCKCNREEEDGSRDL